MDQTILDVWIMASVMRITGANIKAQFGGDSSQYYAFLEAAEKNERLIDSIPGARDFVLKASL